MPKISKEGSANDDFSHLKFASSLMVDCNFIYTVASGNTYKEKHYNLNGSAYTIMEDYPGITTLPLLNKY